ncbi:phenoloxidase-activating factor 2 [Neodiprion lecontei]|uniref:Phenoloxidase-activating factor 2 n=1 Tax=Neodiprion lecontei TaxID=441921 RepID=A0A6J0C3D7_NEOLC|nr:phenoloxidase-activating factor 2 [Neodiprion lecontei]
MQYLGWLVTVLGLLDLGVATPNGRREKRQNGVNSAVENCRKIFNAPCDSLNILSTSTPPPLNTALPKVQVSDCQCVLYNLCSSESVSNSDGSFVIDKRLGETCSGTLDVCCPKSSILNRPIDRATQAPTMVTMPTPSPTATQKPLPTPVPQQPNVPVRSGCGYRNPQGVTVRITGSDNEAQFAEFPWMVAVLTKPPPGTEQSGYICGGSLIHPRAVLTAAHTIEGKSAEELVVRAGDWDSLSRTEPIPHQQLEVEAVILHENFNTDNLHNDFAVLILKTPFVITPSVNTVCLPRENDVFDAVRCTATGWGKNTFEAVGRFQAVLKKIELPVVPHTPCQTNLRRTRLGNAFILDQSFICAGGEAGQDTCTGDGGSPLVCPSKNAQDRYVQAGIVAWGIGCGADRTPGVYASVSKARRWIDGKMAQYNLDTSSYLA